MVMEELLIPPKPIMIIMMVMIARLKDVLFVIVPIFNVLIPKKKQMRLTKPRVKVNQRL